jgi:hypothetical protein
LLLKYSTSRAKACLAVYWLAGRFPSSVATGLALLGGLEHDKPVVKTSMKPRITRNANMKNLARSRG